MQSNVQILPVEGMRFTPRETPRRLLRTGPKTGLSLRNVAMFFSPSLRADFRVANCPLIDGQLFSIKLTQWMGSIHFNASFGNI